MTLNKQIYVSICLALIGVLWIEATSGYSLFNQGDFDKVLGYAFGTKRFISEYTGNLTYPLQSDAPIKLEDFTSSLGLFWLWAKASGLFSDVFNLAALGLIAKYIFLFGNIYYAFKLSDGDISAYVVLSVASIFLAFLPYNSALLLSLYTEYTLFLAFPFIAGILLMKKQTCVSISLIALLSAIAGTAKTQFFYIPLLLLIVLIPTLWMQSRKMMALGICALCVAQAICMVTLQNNKFRQLNYYHSTYFGSYMAASPETLDAIGLPIASRSCIGVDVWDNAYSSLQSDVIEKGRKTCFGKKELTTKDIIAVYMTEPLAFIRLTYEAMKTHFTVNYFHVDRKLPYIYKITPQGGYVAPDGWIQKLISSRDIASKVYAPIVIIGTMLLSILSLLAKTRAVSFFLAGFIVSQIAISLLGEGVRDLSRHLQAAQYALDILTVVFLAQIYFALRPYSANSDMKIKSTVH